MKKKYLTIILLSICLFGYSQSDSLDVVHLDDVNLYKKDYTKYKNIEISNKKKFTISFSPNSSLVSLFRNGNSRIKIIAIEYKLNEGNKSNGKEMYFHPILSRELKVGNVIAGQEKIYYTENYNKPFIIDVSDKNILLEKNEKYYLGLFYISSEESSSSAVLETVVDRNSQTYFCKPTGNCIPVTSFNNNGISLRYRLYYELLY